MKIEIELEEFELLRSLLQTEQKKVEELEIKLKDLSEQELIQKAVRLSYRLFDNYMATVFEHLGFHDKWPENTVIIRDNLEHFIGKDWWTSDRITFELGAQVTTNFKSAFLRIGIITKDKVKEKSDDAYKL